MLTMSQAMTCCQARCCPWTNIVSKREQTMQLRTKLTALVMAGGAAALVLTSTPAIASSPAVTETAYGAIYGKAAAANNSAIPLTWRGLVSAHGVFVGGAGQPKKGQQHTFTTSAGTLTVLVSGTPSVSESVNVKACHFAFSLHVPFTILGGKSTGKFAGASGSGSAAVSGAGYGPRYTSGPHKGQCNSNPNAPELTKGAVETFQLGAHMKL
jgi:hypothetical protein